MLIINLCLIFYSTSVVLSESFNTNDIQQLVEFENRSYYFEPNLNVDWYQATNFCRRLGMNLVSIETEEENAFITRELKKIGGLINYWTSGSDLAQTLQYVWHSTGQSANYFNWALGQPDNREVANCTFERAIHLSGDEPKWYDAQPFSLLHFICEEEETIEPVKIFKELYGSNDTSVEPFVDLGGTLYHFETNLLVDWYEANNFCRRLGMHLVSVETPEENALIVTHLNSIGGGLPYAFWTSGSDLSSIGRYIWHGTGTNVAYSSWFQGDPKQPDRLDRGNCNIDKSIAFFEADLMWHDFPPYFLEHFICEQLPLKPIHN